MRLAIEPAPGLFTDDTTFSQQMRYTDGYNFRWKDGRPQSIGGWVKEFTQQLSGVCRNVLAWRDLNASVNIALGTHSHLYVHLSGTLSDITPVGLAPGAIDSALGPGYGTGAYGGGEYGEGDSAGYFARTWSLQSWGENLMANPRGGTVYLWQNDPANKAVAIANAPDNVNTILVTPERQVLAFGCNEETSGVFNPMCIRGTAIRDYDNWTTSLIGASKAFEYVLEAAGGGRIVGAKVIGAYVAVWTDIGLFIGEYVDNGQQIYRFDLVATNCGLIGPNAVEVVNKRAWWMTPDRLIYTWAPGEAPAIVPCPIRGDFHENMAEGQGDKIVATGIGEFGEVAWFYPDARDGRECSRFVLLNVAGASLLWSRGILARSAVIDAGATPSPIFVSPDGYVYAHEQGQDANGGPIEWCWTISLPYLDAAGRFVMLKGMEPDFLGQVGPVSIAFDLRKYPQSNVVSKGPYTLAEGAVRKHFTMSGRIADVTFSGSSAPTFARMGKPVLLGEVTGQE